MPLLLWRTCSRVTNTPKYTEWPDHQTLELLRVGTAKAFPAPGDTNQATIRQSQKRQV
jgi:hypothetical protein